jgi:hypothetical protein
VSFDPPLSVTEFRTRYPEFASAENALIEAKLLLVVATIDAQIWGTVAREAAYLLCAHYLALSPFGLQARLSASGISIYQQQFDRLQLAATFGVRTT